MSPTDHLSPRDRISRIASPVGRARLRGMLRSGLPERLGAPLLAVMEGRLDSRAAEVVVQIEAIRADLAARGDEQMPIYAHPPGEGPPRTRSMRFVAEVSSVQAFWGALLHLLAEASQAETILELGSCAGISGSYLASSRACRRFVTAEGEPKLAELAESNLHRVANRAEVLNLSFDRALDRVLPSLAAGLDLVYLDGGKSKPNVVRWVERAIPHLNDGALVVLDDIHHSREMEQAWEVMCRRRGFTHAVDTSRFGLLLWGPGADAPATYRIFGFRYLDMARVRRVVRGLR